MLKKLISIVFVITVAMVTTVFSHSAEIENTGENRYKAIRVTQQIYNNAKHDLSDLLIKNSSGEAVPYFINSGFSTARRDEQHYDMLIINSYTKDGAFYFDYKIKEPPEHDAAATSVELLTNDTNFAKNVVISGSYDDIYWEKIQDDVLYSTGDHKKLEIVFHSPQKYTHYRFKLGNNLEKIAFSSVVLKYSGTAVEQIYFLETLTPSFKTENKDKNTYINIEGLKNLKLADITIETDSMFKRRASMPGISKEIYNLSLNGTTYRDTSIQAEGYRSDTDILTVVINNNDDKPVDVNGVTVKYYADELVFDGSAGAEFTLSFGDPLASPPVYDIVSYKNEILKGPVDKLEIKEIKMDDKSSQKEGYDYTIVFNAVVICITVLLGLLIAMKLKKNS